MTPTQMWEGFNPVKEPLEASLVSSTVEDDVLITKYFFTSETVADGKVRVLCHCLVNKNWKEKHPVIMVLPAILQFEQTNEVLKKLVALGYTTLFVDYANLFSQEDLHTTFPKSLDYANAQFAKNDMMFMGESARETPRFQWAKICRRALSLVDDVLTADNQRICVLGFGEGAQLTWLLAGIDGRLKTAIPVMGGGYSFLEGSQKFSSAKKVVPDEKHQVWMAGVGAESYARLVTCPIYQLTSSNNAFCDVDRANDILKFAQIKHKALAISPRTNLQLTSDIYNSSIVWLKEFLDNQTSSHVEIVQPEMTFENINGDLCLRLKNASSFADCSVYFALDTSIAACRDWIFAKTSYADPNTGDNIYKINLYDFSNPVFAFANCQLENGIIVSTPVSCAFPSEFNLTCNLLSKTQPSRIVYNNSMGLSTFSAENTSLVLDENVLELHTGANDILGITVKFGDLITYKLGKSAFSAQNDILLCLDLYSKTERDVTISMRSFKDRHSFFTTVHLKGGEIWQRICLSASDFKTKDNFGLQRFDHVEKLVFLNFNGVLLNNVLWV